MTVRVRLDPLVRPSDPPAGRGEVRGTTLHESSNLRPYPWREPGRPPKTNVSEPSSPLGPTPAAGAQRRRFTERAGFSPSAPGSEPVWAGSSSPPSRAARLRGIRVHLARELEGRAPDRLPARYGFESRTRRSAECRPVVTPGWCTENAGHASTQDRTSVEEPERPWCSSAPFLAHVSRPVRLVVRRLPLRQRT